MTRRLLVSTAVTVALASAIGIAQQFPSAQSAAPLAFEVASVRLNKTGDRTSFTDTEPGGRFIATNMPLRTLITSAYELRSFELIGAPDWTGAERFDIVAKAAREFGPAAPGRPDPDKLMLQSLLADRFALRVHRETRELPVYALTLARADGRPGSRIRRSQTGCTAWRASVPAATGPPQPRAVVGERPPCFMRSGYGTLVINGYPIDELRGMLSSLVGRTVVDRTGLTGEWDLELTWTPDEPSRAAVAPAVDPNGPSLFTALQEQLGLKLESTKGPVEVLVVDRVERPSED
jgi:uncharacterized protein (TIGR03435 family)